MKTVALIGKANVGKSTLFNRLCGCRDAIVHDQPGLTRDRRYGVAQNGSQEISLIDTGGLFDDSDIGAKVDNQTEVALAEADTIAFVTDARQGAATLDAQIADKVRRLNKDVLVILNKVDGVRASDLATRTAELSFGFDSLVSVSATNGEGIGELRSVLFQGADEREATANSDIRVAIVGRSNVGKSTLINAIVGAERCVVFDEVGTTRDAIDVPFLRDGKNYTLIDTAGIRRRGRVKDAVEKFSVVKALDSMSHADVSCVVVDATEGIVDQDLHVLEQASELGTGLLVLLNKTDLLDQYTRSQARVSVVRRLKFAPWIPVAQVSALRGGGINRVFREIERIYSAGEFEVATPELNRVLSKAVAKHSPPLFQGRQVKLRYAHKFSSHPPGIMIHGNQTKRLPRDYRRHLSNVFRSELDLYGNPLKIQFKSSENPFKGRKNQLTPRQQKRRQRLIQNRLARS